MSPRGLGLACLTAMAVAGLTGVARAQDQTAAPPQAAGGGQTAARGAAADPTAEMTPQEIERLFDTDELFQAQKALGLSDADFLKFGSRFQILLKGRQQHRQERQKLLAQINQATGPRAGQPGVAQLDDNGFVSVSKALDDLEVRAAQQEQQALVQIDEVLTPRQRARLRVFLENQEQRKLSMIALARQRAQSGRGGGLAPAPPTGRRGGD